MPYIGYKLTRYFFMVMSYDQGYKTGCKLLVEASLFYLRLSRPKCYHLIIMTHVNLSFYVIMMMQLIRSGVVTIVFRL